MKIDQFLNTALQSNASDLHFVSGDPVRARIHGTLQVVDKIDRQVRDTKATEMHRRRYGAESLRHPED